MLAMAFVMLLSIVKCLRFSRPSSGVRSVTFSAQPNHIDSSSG